MVCLDLGCGLNKKAGFTGIDSKKLEGVDIVDDIYQALSKFEDNSVDMIYSRSFFEHAENLELLISECFRVLKNEGTLEIIVPHFSNPYFYSDYTHKNYMGLYTFCYFSDNKYFKRKVPVYYNSTKFTILSVNLNFKSPFKLRNFLKRCFGYLFNLNKYMQELYEEIFSRIISCYEIEILLRPIK